MSELIIRQESVFYGLIHLRTKNGNKKYFKYDKL